MILNAQIQPLPAERSFVVQFRGTAPLSPENFSGRIEHIASGETMFFSSPDELYRFVSKLPRTADNAGGDIA